MKSYLFALVTIVAFSKSYSQSTQLLDTTMARAVSERGYADTRVSFHNFSGSGPKGYSFTNDSLLKKITFINFWFEDCAPCIAEFDALNKLYEKYNHEKNFQFISITFENDNVIERVSKKYKLKYPVIHIDAPAIDELNFKLGYPVNMIVNTNGMISFIKAGGASDRAHISADFEKIYFKQVERLLYPQ